MFGGAGGYNVKIIDGLLSPIDDEGIFEYIVPSNAGEYFVTILDRSGAWTQASVQVSGSSDFEPVFPGGMLYDLVKQFGIGESGFVENSDTFSIQITLKYNPSVALPVNLYLRWKLPGGSYRYVKTWDGETDFKNWGMNLTSEPESFVGVFALIGKMFDKFGIYGDLFSPVSKAELMALGGTGIYRFEFILKPAGSFSRDEYSIPVYLRVQ